MNVARGRVLVVDDDDRIATLLRELLRGLGYDVTTVGNAEEIAGTVASFRPDVVLLDLHMPGIAGFEGLEYFRADHPGLPVIVVTGDAVAEVAEQSRARGAFDLLGKPFGVPALQRIVSAAMELRRA
jgi:CheY-like chemotaxis protein